jgi:hypothetical protein
MKNLKLLLKIMNKEHIFTLIMKVLGVNVKRLSLGKSRVVYMIEFSRY